LIWPAAVPIVVTPLAEAVFQQCSLAKVHAIRIRQRVGDRQAAGYPDSSNTDASGKPIHCTAAISKYAVGTQEEDEFRVDRLSLAP